MTSSTRSRETLDLARHWLKSCDSCLQIHKLCARLRQEATTFPSRVLDVGSDGSSIWHLHITAEDGIPSEPYMTLSHCWGGNRVFKLTTASLGLMRRGQLFTELPSNFRDAILFARHFQVRYIWIDALCIIQDSKEDWSYESSRMKDVYHIC